MLTTVITLKNANFEGKGLPNLFPFVSKATLDFAYDFSIGGNRFIDLSGNYTEPAEVYKNDIAAGVINQKDSSGLVELPDGGIRVEHGYIKLPVLIDRKPLSETEFTIMVTGAPSNKDFPLDKVVATKPTLGCFIDMGSAANTSGYTLDYAPGSGAQGARIKSGAITLEAGSRVSKGVKVTFFLSYKDGVWSIYDSRTKTTVTKADTELGLTDDYIMPPFISIASPNIIVGGSVHPASTLSSGFVDMYQVARWDKKLTDAEIAQQLVNI